MKIKGIHILRAWFGTMTAYFIALQCFDHIPVSTSLFAIMAIEVLSFFLCVAIALREPNAKNKAVFINFALFFSVGLVGMAGKFISSPYDYKIFELYTSYGSYALLLTFSIAYLSIDVLFRDFTTVAKYAVTVFIVGSFFFGYFHHFVQDPTYVYHTQDMRDWKAIDAAVQKFENDNKREPTPQEIAGATDLFVYNGNEAVAVLKDDARLRRVEEMMPYLLGDNFQVLMSKPVMVYMMQMSIASIGFILLFFGYLYMKDPPQGAYIEKIMFLLLVFCSMEVLHSWSAINAVEWTTMAEIVATGQYASNAALVLIALYLSLRLRFISSIRGEFYESELSERPAGITRWRDTLDNMVVESFFNRQTLMGRLFAVPEHQRHQH
jgi:hypothetical protein